MRTIGFVMVWACLASVGAARNVYVNNLTGDDTFNGANERQSGEGDGPVRTIAKALRLAAAGDRVVLANTGEPYRECVSLVGGDHGGSFLGPFTILGNGAVLDGTMPIAPDAWEHYVGDVFRFRPPRMAFQQLYLDGRPAVRRSTDEGVQTIARLAPREWCFDQGHIYYCVEPGRTVHDYRLSCARHPAGLTLYQVHGVLIADLIVQGFQLDGINAHDRADDCRLVNVTARGNGRSGVAAAGTSHIELDGCLVGDNGASQLYTEGFATITVRASDVLANTAPAVERRGGEVIVLPDR